MSSSNEFGTDGERSHDGCFRATLDLEDSVEHVDSILRAGRWVELIGLPGIGKSTLARQLVADREQNDEEDWIVFDGAPYGAGGDAIAALAETASIQTGDGSDPLRLASRIGRRLESRGIDGLLIDHAGTFDNAVELLSQLRESGFGVAWLSTSTSSVSPSDSRKTIRIEPMSVPDAVELYRRTARRHWVGRAELELDREGVEHLVRTLDCHPLAVEIAAGRINTLGPRELHERVEKAAASTEGYLSELPGLGSVLSEGVEHLDDRTRLALVVAAQFTGPFALEWLERALANTGADATGIANVIDSLVRNGWLRTEFDDTDTRRFKVPEPLRSFVRESENSAIFDPDPDAVALHCRTIRLLAESLVSDLVSGTNAATLHELQQLLPEMLAAFDRTRDIDPEAAARVIAPARWLVRQGTADGLVRPRLGNDFRNTVAEHASTATAARIELFAALLQRRANRIDQAEESLASARRRTQENSDRRLRAEIATEFARACRGTSPAVGERRAEEAADIAARCDRAPLLRALAMKAGGQSALEQFDLDRAREQLTLARSLCDECGDEVFQPSTLAQLGYVEHRLDLGNSALETLARAAELFDSSSRSQSVGRARFNYGAVAWTRGELETAAEQLEKAADILAATGTDAQTAAARVRLGAALFELGRVDSARNELREALALAQQCRDQHNQALAEATLAALRDQGASGREFSAPLRDLETRTNPVAYAAFAAFSAACFALDGQPDRGEKRAEMLDEVDDALAEKDVYFRRTLEWIRRACRALLDETPSPSDEAPDNGWARFLYGLFEHGESRQSTSRIIPAREERRHRLRVHRHGHWFRVDDESPVDLTSRNPLRRILGALVEIAHESDRAAASVEELIEVGWPDVTPTRSSGSNRVYYSIRKLRDLGLEEILVTTDDGYHLDPTTRLRVSDKPWEAVS